MSQDKYKSDDVAKDILSFAHKYLGLATNEVQAAFVQDLCIYITERDYKTLQHGQKIAKEALDAK